MHTLTLASPHKYRLFKTTVMSFRLHWIFIQIYIKKHPNPFTFPCDITDAYFIGAVVTLFDNLRCCREMRKPQFYAIFGYGIPKNGKEAFDNV